MVHAYDIPDEKEYRTPIRQMKPTYVTESLFDSTGDIRTIHSHKDTVEIGLVYEGRGRSYIDGRTYHTIPGSLVIYNANALHQDRAEEGEEYRFFVIGLENLRLEGRSPGKIIEDPDYFCVQSGCYYQYLLEGFRMVERGVREDDANVLLFAESFAQSLIAIVMKLTEQEQRRNGRARRTASDLGTQIREYIDENYASHFTLDELAEMFHINRYYASHVFSKSFGRSPMGYRTHRRIGEAQTLLTATDKSISEIASVVGYDSASRFGRTFSKMVGMSPSEYRELSKNSSRRVQDDTPPTEEQRSM